MPVVMFTTDEVLGTLIDRMRDLSHQVNELAELDPAKGGKPLDPGESVAARHHKIAKLGRQLADAFLTFRAILEKTTPPGPEPEAPSAAEPNPQAN